MPPITSYDVLENVRDVSPIFNRTKLPNTPLLNAIGMGVVAQDTKHYWWDDVRLPIATTLGAAYTQATAAGVFTVASSVGLRVGSILRVDGQVKRVTVVTDATTITTAHIGGDADADIAISTAVEFVANAEVEGKDYEDSDYTPKVERMNVTQIISDWIKLTGTQLAVQRELTGDVLIEEVEKKLERLKLGLGRAIWTNPRVSPSTNSDRRVLGSVNWFIEQYGYSPAAANIYSGATPGANADNLDAFLLYMESIGANITQLWFNPTEMAEFAALDSSKLTKDYDDQTIGRKVTRYISKYGHEVSLVTDVNAPSKKLYCFENSQLKLVPLNGRQLKYGELATTGDNKKAMLVGEYTLEFNGSATAGVFTIS